MLYVNETSFGLFGNALIYIIMCKTSARSGPLVRPYPFTHPWMPEPFVGCWHIFRPHSLREWTGAGVGNLSCHKFASTKNRASITCKLKNYLIFRNLLITRQILPWSKTVNQNRNVIAWKDNIHVLWTVIWWYGSDWLRSWVATIHGYEFGGGGFKTRIASKFVLYRNLLRKKILYLRHVPK